MKASVMVDKLAEGIERYMDLVALRQRLVSANIANAETPNYRTKDVDFASQMQAVLEGDQPKISEPAGLAAKTDGNNVSMEREMRLLSENAMRFQIASTLLKTEVRQIKTAIQEGKGA